MVRRRQSFHAARMIESPETHFFTARGALCGATIGSRWSLVESLTTCPTCRELLQTREHHKPLDKRGKVVPLGRIRGAP
jgi:hypothetical protein